MHGLRGREAEQRQPIVPCRAGERLMSVGVFMAAPAAGAEVVIGLIECQEPRGHAFVDLEIGPEAGIEPFDGTGGAVALLPELLHLLEQDIRRVSESQA